MLRRVLATPTNVLKMDVKNDPRLSILQSIHFSSHSEVEGESDGEVEFTVEPSRPRKAEKNGESKPLIRSSRNGILSRLSSEEDDSKKKNVFEDPEYSSVIQLAEEAMENGVLPERIYQGSSGSYFVKNMQGDNIGVFKPKDEEPYGHLNPKWTKWLHKICCPCCFGRSCLVPNQGYLSEVGASLVDERLGLNVVPKTKLVYLSSDTFHYHFNDRFVMGIKRYVATLWPDTFGNRLNTDWPKKAGSFQLFVKGYKDASTVLDEMRQDKPSAHLQRQLQLQFERMVVLDYIIRNTDRGNDNWLVSYELPCTVEDKREEELIALDESAHPRTLEVARPESAGHVKVAAIDNGLAFPFKHPDEWRAYPFYWAWLPMAREPFSENICYLVLDKLKNPQFVQSLINDLQTTFGTDKGFDMDIFEKQVAVMRGQILNLINALEQKKSPYELVRMPPVTIEGVRIGRARRFIQRFRHQTPFFQWC